MSFTATPDMDIYMARLKRWLSERVGGLRTVCKPTESLMPPEVMAHSNLSAVLNRKPKQNIYFQQFLVLMKIAHLSPAAMFLDTDDASAASDAIKLANAFLRLKPARRDALLESVLSEAPAQRVTAT